MTPRVCLVLSDGEKYPAPIGNRIPVVQSVWPVSLVTPVSHLLIHMYTYL